MNFVLVLVDIGIGIICFCLGYIVASEEAIKFAKERENPYE